MSCTVGDCRLTIYSNFNYQIKMVVMEGSCLHHWKLFQVDPERNFMLCSMQEKEYKLDINIMAVTSEATGISERLMNTMYWLMNTVLKEGK